jgi:hypothetical protein
MNIDTKEVRVLEDGEQPKPNEGMIIRPNPFPGDLSKLGLLRVQMGDGSIKEFRMNRAERRRFIKQNHLTRIVQ